MLEEIIRTVDLECIAPEICARIGNGPKTQGKVCVAVISKTPPTYLGSHFKVGTECRFGAYGQANEAVLYKEVQN